MVRGRGDFIRRRVSPFTFVTRTECTFIGDVGGLEGNFSLTRSLGPSKFAHEFRTIAPSHDPMYINGKIPNIVSLVYSTIKILIYTMPLL
jgi:hypothetical protein